MILKKLNLKNYRRFKNLNLDFDENIMVFVGKNGAGKTTIFEAILYALFGTGMARTSKEDIKADFVGSDQDCQISLTFELENKQYRIERRIKGKNFITDAFVFTPEKGDKPIAERETGVNDFVKKLLGMNSTTFKISVFSAQKELDKFSSLQAEKRKAEIRRLLYLEIIKQAIKILRADIRANKHRVEGLESQQKNTKEIKDKIVQFKTNIKKQEEQIKQISKVYQNLKSELKKQKSQIKSLEKLSQENNRLDKRIGVINSKIKNVQENLIRTTKSTADLIKKKSQLKTLSSIKVEYQKVKLERKNFDQSPLQKKLSKFKKKSDELQTDANKQQNVLVKVKQEGKGLKDEFIKVRQKLEKIKKLGRSSPCPECTRPLNEHYDDLVGKFNQEMKTIRQKIDEKWGEYQNIEKTLKTFKKEKENIDQKILLIEKRLSEKKQKLEERLMELEAQNKRIIELESRLKQLPQLERQKKQFLTDKKSFGLQLEKASQKIKSLNFDQQQFEEEKGRLDRLQEKHNRIVKQTGEIKGDIKENGANLKNCQKELQEQKELKRKIKELVKRNRILASLEPLFDDFEKDLLARIRPILEKETSDLLQIITQNKYSDVELDRDYEVYLYDKGERYKIKRFSGGEQDLINLCLRLAISRVIAEKSGSRKINFLILDEIFGSQDEDRQKNILQALQGLSTQFRQLFLISHVTGIKDQMPIVYEVLEKNKNESELKLLN